MFSFVTSNRFENNSSGTSISTPLASMRSGVAARKTARVRICTGDMGISTLRGDGGVS